MTHCSICGKKLTDKTSVARGIGPECILRSKQDSVGQGNIFAPRAIYDYAVEGDVLALKDLGGMKSLTNDMEVALKEIESTEGDISGYRIMYCDSHGEWDAVQYNNGHVRFLSLGGTTDKQKALKVLNKIWKSAYSTQS